MKKCKFVGVVSAALVVTLAVAGLVGCIKGEDPTQGTDDPTPTNPGNTGTDGNEGGDPGTTPQTPAQTITLGSEYSMAEWATMYVFGNLDAMFMGQVNSEYKEAFRVTDKQIAEAYEGAIGQGMQDFADYFGVDLSEASAGGQTIFYDLVKDVYAKSYYTYGRVDVMGGNHIVEIWVYPITELGTIGSWTLIELGEEYEKTLQTDGVQIAVDARIVTVDKLVREAMANIERDEEDRQAYYVSVESTADGGMTISNQEILSEIREAVVVTSFPDAS